MVGSKLAPAIEPIHSTIEELHLGVSEAYSDLGNALTLLQWAQQEIAEEPRSRRLKEPPESEPLEATGLRHRVEERRRELLEDEREYINWCEVNALRHIAEHSARTRMLADTLVGQGVGIYRLPQELLAQIFLWTWEDHTPLRLLDICHVCSRWRSTALSTPRLWTCLIVSLKGAEYHDPREQPVITVHPWNVSGNNSPSRILVFRNGGEDLTLHDPEHVRCWVERARACLICLTIDWDARDHNKAKAWAYLILQISSHLAVINFEGGGSENSSVYKDFRFIFHRDWRRSFPALRLFNFSFSIPRTPSSDLDPTFDMPNLKSLSYTLKSSTHRQLSVNWASFRNLTHVCGPFALLHSLLNFSSSKDVMSFCKTVRHLEIVMTGEDNEPPTDGHLALPLAFPVGFG